jgi:hypothetical protein
VRRKDSSFSEEKEAKRLFRPGARAGTSKVGKVFWFFFSKKNVLS